MQETRLTPDLQCCLESIEAPGELTDALLRNPSDIPDLEMVRLGRLLGLDLHRAVVLVLKRQWERFRLEREAEGPDRPLSAVPRQYLHREFHAGASGTADASELFRLFEEAGRLATGSGYDLESFEILIHHCILLHLHLLSIHGPEVEGFAASQQVQQALLAAASPGERETFWRHHRLWREMEDEVGSLLLEVESQALENRRIERQWMETFGTAYLKLLEAEARFLSLERAVQRKTEDPHLTLEDLEALEAEDLQKVEQELARLRRGLARSRASTLTGPGGMPLEGLESLGYAEESRRLLREIYRLTHPDVVGQHGFTELQRERLTGYYREALACADTAGIDEEEIALGMRSLVSLEGILSQVRKIWECEGLDVNEGAVVCGETLAARVEWLEARIAELEEQAKQVRADLLAVATDADVREKLACLRSRGQIAEITGEMEKKRQWHETQIPALQARLQELFVSSGEPVRTPP